MRIFTNRDVKHLFVSAGTVAAVCLAFSLTACLLAPSRAAPVILGAEALGTAGILALCVGYFRRQDRILAAASERIDTFLAGDTSARIACDREGELYKLFHAVNTLAAVLNAHAENEQRGREFLKDTISDISHQLKTPLAALNIYNGLVQEEAAGRDGERDGEGKALQSVGEFAALSEQELDRMESLVQSLLKITKMDAGALIPEKALVNMADILAEVERQFAFCARQEGKSLTFAGEGDGEISCDEAWMEEAIGNLVKNALDHTGAGDHVRVRWKGLPSQVRVTVEDNGSGIHPEDIHHIFKRFYRSRFSKDTQGAGLGLPLAKAIIEAHGGSLAVDSVLGEGSVFTVNLTKL